MRKEDIVSVYRAVLHREPQGDAVINWHILEHGNLENVVEFLIGSDEFRRSIRAVRSITPQLAFEAVYGRVPTVGEAARMVEYVDSLIVLNTQSGSASAVLSSQEMLRAAVTAFPRDSHPTPIVARFEDKHLVKASVKGRSGKLVLDRLDWSVSCTIIATGEYERHLGRFIEQVVKPGMVCIDIGANVGYHALTMSELVGPTGHVYAIEPNSENCRMLMLSIEENGGSNVTILPVALSDRLGAVAFSPAVGSNGSFMYTMENPLHHPNCNIVPTVCLDSILNPDRIDFIKIDVEGAEALALKGGEKLLEKHRPIITSEFSDAMLRGVSRVSGEDYIGGMMARGYRAYTLGMSAPHSEITNAAAFMAAWPDQFRIEDLAFIPVEKDFDFERFKAEA